MFGRLGFVLVFLFLSIGAVFAANRSCKSVEVNLIRADANNIAIAFALPECEPAAVQVGGETYLDYTLPEQGILTARGRPILPVVARFVILPPDRNVELIVQADDPVVFYPERPLLLGETLDSTAQSCESLFPGASDLFPPHCAAISPPAVMRGVRLAQVTVYPYQYNLRTGELLHRSRIETHLQPVAGPVDNPVEQPIRRNRSRIFQQFIANLALNSGGIFRDDPDRDRLPDYLGHYLVVLPRSLVNASAPFIEWRRKAGYKVDILAMSDNDARNANTVKGQIQTAYNAYLQAGQDPFDLLMLIGDLDSYSRGPAPGSVLTAPRGSPSDGSPSHADYEYALLEGGNIDRFADVGVARWCAGSNDLIALFNLRNEAYSVNPPTNDNWFTRGAVYSQRWSDTWHISLHLAVRWGAEMLRQAGLADIRTYENFNNEDGSNLIGNFCQQQMNAGMNVMFGRCQNRSFGSGITPSNRTIFPILGELGGHHESASWSLLRSPTVQQPYGPSASITYVGISQTVAANVTWMEMTKGLMLDRLPFGWARLQGVVAPTLYMPGYPTQTFQTDVVFYGDPGLTAWIEMPRVVNASLPNFVSTLTRLVEIRVTENNVPVGGANVNLYFPGAMPAFNSDQYPAYNRMFNLLRQSGADGWARFVLNNDAQLTAGTQMFVTATGLDIKPYFGSVAINEPNSAAVLLQSHTWTQVEGNNDDVLNPGERFRLALTACNVSRNVAARNVIASIESASPFIEVEENAQIQFGNIDIGGNRVGNNTIQVNISPVCPDGVSRPALRPELTIRFRADEGAWTTALPVVVAAPHLEFERAVEGIIINEQVTRLTLDLKNVGAVGCPPFEAALTSLGDGISVLDGRGAFPAVAPGRTVQQQGQLFTLVGNRVAVPGRMVKMCLVMRAQDGWMDTTYFDLQNSVPNQSTPLGPDAYGYLCFDDTDQGWDISPVYNWVEIDARENEADFRGSNLNFRGQSPQNIGEAIVIDLPFTTNFYGCPYRQITVTTNGYIVMGAQTSIVSGYNYPLNRGIGGGMGMVAPFWDNLTLGQNGRVYVFYDDEQARYIVQWSRLLHAANGNLNLTFEAILYDAEVWMTATGDQPILFQYKSVRDALGSGIYDINFASVGISSPDGRSGINYSFNDRRPAAAAPLANRRALLFSTSATFRFGLLFGRVTRFPTGEPIADAIIRTSFGQTGISDRNGDWRIERAIAVVPFDISCFAEGYNDCTYVNLEVEESGELEINFNLLHPEIITSTDEIYVSMESDDFLNVPLSIANPGNGLLRWRAAKSLIGEANAEPWTLRRSIPIGRLVNDSGIEGVVFANDRFYVAGAAINGPNDGTNLIYVLSRDGELLGFFEQPGLGMGFSDLAWDGEWLWGGSASGDRRIYAMTMAGQLMRVFEGPYNPNNCLAWDSDREMLWVGKSDMPLIAYDRSGIRQGNQLNRRGLNMYGVDYYPNDPDGCPLYIYNSPGPSQFFVHKMNPANGDTQFVAQLFPPSGERPRGNYLTSEFDVYSWVMVSITDNQTVNGGDRIDIWQVDTYKEWFNLNCYEGMLNPGAQQPLVLSFNTAGLPDTLFEGCIGFTSNAAQREVRINVACNVHIPQRLTPFILLTPPNGDTLQISSSGGEPPALPAVEFLWSRSIAPEENDAVNYVIYLASRNRTVSYSILDTTVILNIDTLGFNELVGAQFQWWVKACWRGDTLECVRRFYFRIMPNIVSNLTAAPTAYALRALYPNPFNSRLTVDFCLERDGWTSLRLYNSAANEIAAVWEGYVRRGEHRIALSADHLPSGVYFLKLTNRNRSLAAKAVLIR